MIGATIVTLGVYFLYWVYRSFSEVKAYRGRGLGGGAILAFLLGVTVVEVVVLVLRPSAVGLWEPALLGLIVVSVTLIFLMPSCVGRMYTEEGLSPAIIGWHGLAWFVPYVGTFIWLGLNQRALNQFWQRRVRIDAARLSETQ